MSWLRRLLQPATKPTEIKGRSRSGPGSMPTVKFDPSTVSESVKADLQRNINLLEDIEKKHAKTIYEIALRSISAGRDLHLFCTELMKMKIEGVTQSRAAEIARLLNDRATSTIATDRRASLGITHAIWMYPNAPCMKNPKRPTDKDVQQNAAHRLANGKQYEISKGLFVDGKWTRPGVEEGCKCTSRPILPTLE